MLFIFKKVYSLEKFVGPITRGTLLGTWPLIEQWSKLYYIGGEGDAEIFSYQVHHTCFNGTECTSWTVSDQPICDLTLPQKRIHSYAMFIPEYMTVCTDIQNVNCVPPPPPSHPPCWPINC